MLEPQQQLVKQHSSVLSSSFSLPLRSGGSLKAELRTLFTSRRSANDDRPAALA